MHVESKEEIKKLLSEEKLEVEWHSYMRCNGLPNANDPSDLRKYLHMWLDDAKKANKREINWLLKTNEQSILTQDQMVVDLSRANLKKLQPEIGETYAKRTSEVLGILDEMDAVIRDRYSLSPHKMDDLLDVSGFRRKWWAWEFDWESRIGAEIGEFEEVIQRVLRAFLKSI